MIIFLKFNKTILKSLFSWVENKRNLFEMLRNSQESWKSISYVSDIMQAKHVYCELRVLNPTRLWLTSAACTPLCIWTVAFNAKALLSNIFSSNCWFRSRKRVNWNDDWRSFFTVSGSLLRWNVYIKIKQLKLSFLRMRATIRSHACT